MDGRAACVGAADRIGCSGMPALPCMDPNRQCEVHNAQLRVSYAPHRPIDIAYRICEELASDEILRAAAELVAELIMLGSQGRTALGRLLMGSVAQEVLRGVTCPTLIVKPSRASIAARNPEPETGGPPVV